MVQLDPSHEKFETLPFGYAARMKGVVVGFRPHSV